MNQKKRGKKNSKKGGKKPGKKSQQKGGSLGTFNDPIHWSSIPAASTSGSFDHLVDNIVGLVESSINAIVDTSNLVLEAVRIPMDMGKMYSGPADPNPYNVAKYT